MPPPNVLFVRQVIGGRPRRGIVTVRGPVTVTTLARIQRPGARESTDKAARRILALMKRRK